MVRRISTLLLAGVLSSMVPIVAAQAQVVPEARTFAVEVDAVRACGSDPVVWINKKNGIYHLKTSRWYGKTKDGAFACQSEADKAGHHQAKDAPATATPAAPPK
jgi:hypothetical protein